MWRLVFTQDIFRQSTNRIVKMLWKEAVSNWLYVNIISCLIIQFIICLKMSWVKTKRYNKLNFTIFWSIPMALTKTLCWALIFITQIRFSLGKSLATIANLIDIFGKAAAQRLYSWKEDENRWAFCEQSRQGALGQKCC